MNSVELFLTAIEEQEVVKAIKKAEKNTSGEIRVHIEHHTEVPALERAKQVFFQLGMDKTRQKNAVLLYIDTYSKQFAIIGDEGIDKVIPTGFWEFEKNLITHYFKLQKNCKALTEGIQFIGEKLKTYFPYQADDVDELSNEISKGL